MSGSLFVHLLVALAAALVGGAVALWLRQSLIVGFLIYALNPDYMKLLFTHPIGKLLVFLAVVMQVVGFLWIRKIINIEI